MIDTVTVFVPGTWVKVGDNRGEVYSGQVIAICIRKGYIEYDVVYWANGERKTVWMAECEVTPIHKPETQEIGFHSVQY